MKLIKLSWSLEISKPSVSSVLLEPNLCWLGWGCMWKLQSFYVHFWSSLCLPRYVLQWTLWSQIFYISKIPIFFNFTREKGMNRDIFGKEIINEDGLLIYFEQNVSFCNYLHTPTQTQSSYFVWSLFALLLKILPKTFYTSATCATFGKFHVCCLSSI